MKLHVPENTENFLTSRGSIIKSSRTLIHGVSQLQCQWYETGYSVMYDRAKLPPHLLIWSVSLSKCRITYRRSLSPITEVAINTEMPVSQTITYHLLLFALDYIIPFYPVFVSSGWEISGSTHLPGHELSWLRLLMISISTSGIYRNSSSNQVTTASSSILFSNRHAYLLLRHPTSRRYNLANWKIRHINQE
jgi:hypothetical protein